MSTTSTMAAAMRQVRSRGDAARRPPLRPATALPAAERTYFEHRLGADFSQVQVHTDGEAAEMAAVIGAEAFAGGEHIVFGRGRYRPGTTQGRELLAHELAHVAQQQHGVAPAGQAESRARSAAGTVAQGGSVDPGALGGAGAGIHCDPVEDKKDAGPTAQPSLLPPMPNFQLSTLPPLDYLKLQGIAGAHGQRFSARDSADMAAEWKRSAAMLRLFGLDGGIHLGPLSWTGDELLNSALSKQYSDRLSRDNPNASDRFDMQFKQAYPGGFTIPPGLLSHTWTF